MYLFICQGNFKNGVFISNLSEKKNLYFKTSWVACLHMLELNLIIPFIEFLGFMLRKCVKNKI